MELRLHESFRLLQSFKTRKSLCTGKQLHSLFCKIGIDSTTYFGNCLVQMYARLNELIDARKLFDEMPDRNCFSWNTMLEAYSKIGNCKAALKLFNEMPWKNEFSWNTIIDGLTRTGDLRTANWLFDEMPLKNSIAWNSVVHGYIKHGQPKEALRLFKIMNLDHLDATMNDGFILATITGACASIGSLDCGKQIHAHLIISGLTLDSVLKSSIVNMYGKCNDLDSARIFLDSMHDPDEFSLSALITGYANCGRLKDARKVFDRGKKTTVVPWNSMISGFVNGGYGEEALSTFNKMRRERIQADTTTLTSVFTACASARMLECGRQMHCHACKVGFLFDTIIGSTIIDMYNKCHSLEDACKFFGEINSYDTILINSMINVYFNIGRINDARYLFESMPYRSLLSWNSMIVGYNQNGCFMDALELFSDMHRRGLQLDEVCLASVISSCGNICAQELGEQVFALSTVLGSDSNQIICTSLVDLYCKCGHIENARKIFNNMIKTDEIPWNSMLMGYATNGYGMEVLELFKEMRNAGMRPNSITFIAVLSGCGHCGLVKDGRRLFHAMKNEYHLNPLVEHYACMVDLFARAGRLEEALEFIEQMPFEADVNMWSSILRGCKELGDESLGAKVAKKIMKLDSGNSGAYVQLSGIYAAQGKWETSSKVRNMMQENHIRKNPGYSWIEK